MRAYNITAPEEIAKEYGGNKKKIQQAASQGIISPTEAVMAGMFIDRMRNAAAQEQAQQPSVAEQVMNPQPPMPPQAQMGAPMQRMAMGGGVDSIPFDEGDYAEGGIVSFNVAGSTYAQAKTQLQRQLAASRIQSERDAIKGQLAQLEAQYRKSTYQPSLAEANLNAPAMDTETGFSGAVEPSAAPAAPIANSAQYPADVVSGKQYPDVPTEMGQLDFQLPAVKGSPGQAVPMEEGLSAGLAATDVGRRIVGRQDPRLFDIEQQKGRGQDPRLFDDPNALPEQQKGRGQDPRLFDIEQQKGRGQDPRLFGDLAEQVKEVNKATEDLKPNTVKKDDPSAAETALDAANREANAMTNAAQNTASDDFQKQIEDLMEPAEKGEFRKEMEALVKDRSKRLKSAKKEAFSMALLQAGLGMLGQGGGQTALQALGKAALPATKQYASAIKDAKKEDRELLQLGLSMEQMDAKELAATKRAVAQLYGKRSAAMLQSATSQANNMRTVAASKYGADVRREVGLAQAAAAEEQARQTAKLRKDLGTVESLRMERAELNDLVDKQAKAVADDGGVRTANIVLMEAQSKLARDPKNETLRAEFILAQEELRKAQEAAIARSIYTPLIQEQRGVVQSLGTNAVDFSSLNP